MRSFDIQTITVEKDAFRIGNEFLVTDIYSEEESFHLTNGNIKAGFTFFITILEGSMEISLNDRTFNFGKNELFVCNQGAIMHSLRMSSNCRAQLVGYYLPFFFPENNSYVLTQFWDRMMEPIILKLSEERMKVSMMMHAFSKNTLSHFTDKEFRKEALIGYLRIALATIGEWVIEDAEHKPDVQTEEDKLFTLFIKDIRENCMTERSLSFYASKAHLSTKYFSSLIYKHSGIHASEWVKKYTIINAKGLLKSKKFTVQQVSEKMNFPNSSFFGKYFKEAVGMTPRHYMLNDEF